jgi:hypothetical protein
MKEPASPPARPPRLAEGMIWLLTPAHSREPVLGDLAEEFCDISARQTPGRAQAWYWKQVLTSSPYLVNWQMRGSHWLAAFVALALGYLVLSVVLTGVFALFHQLYTVNFFQGMIALALGVRLGFEAIAMLAGGLAVGFILAQTEHNHWRHLAASLAIFAGLILWPSIFKLVAGTPIMPQLYVLSRAGMTLPLLVIGAVAGRNLAAFLVRRRSR